MNKLPYKAFFSKEPGFLGQWTYRVVAGNNKVVSSSRRGYLTKRGALNAVAAGYPDAVCVFES